MPIVYRSTLGRPLTFNELDGNFADLAARTDVAWMMDGLEPTLREGVGNPAELAAFVGNTIAYSFVPTAISETFVNWDVPFNWKAGTDLYAAVHWSPGNSSSTGNVRWGIEFTTAEVGGIFGATQTTYITGASDGTPFKHFQSVSVAYPGSSANYNQRFLIRFFRDGGNVADTFPDEAYLVGIDFYYQVDQFGTPSYTPPYS